MACRKLISSANKLNFNSVRSFTTSVRTFSSKKNDELAQVTHTGQVYDEKDYRNVRFTNAARIVNDKWAINLIAEIPPKECTERVVFCDGGGDGLGHPKVYINLDKPGVHDCTYCGLRFTKKDDHHH